MTVNPPLADALTGFHPAVVNWFRHTFPAATGAQARAWPLIRARRSTLVAAPTGSGKTLTAFLAAIDELVRDGLAHGAALPDQTSVVYVSPLKALSNDIRVNLQEPLAGIAAELAQLGLPPLDIRTAVRTGDTTQQERAAVRKRAPHILVTTPESLYVLLEFGFRPRDAVHDTHRDRRRDSRRRRHQARRASRAEPRTPRRAVRRAAGAHRFVRDAKADRTRGEVSGGEKRSRCEIVDVGHVRARDLALEMPPMPLEAIMSNDVWERVYDRLAELVAQHRTTLVFVNTRRMAERAARHLTERLGKDAVAAHHGSLAREHRLDAEQRLKRGELRVLIATASLELGIDIGDVELVCQIGSPRDRSADFCSASAARAIRSAGCRKGGCFRIRATI